MTSRSSRVTVGLMPFVKIDTQILDSTLWFERDSREVFITALLMAEPREFLEPQSQLEVDSLNPTGYVVPAGWYGFVPASSTGIIRRSLVDMDTGLSALQRLGSPEETSRSKEFEGRRMIRVNGGFIILNYMRFREHDYTAAERARRYRENKNRHAVTSRDVTPDRRDVTPDRRDVTPDRRNVTQAEAEAEAEVELKTQPSSKVSSSSRSPKNGSRTSAAPTVSQIIEEVQNQPAFQSIDVQREYEKCLAWCSTNGHQVPSKRRLVNWCLRSLENAPLFGSAKASPADRKQAVRDEAFLSALERNGLITREEK